jgi:hypothetical protein
MSKPKRDFKCEEIDFLGRRRRDATKDKKLAKLVIKKVADPKYHPNSISPGSAATTTATTTTSKKGTVANYCAHRRWNQTEKLGPCLPRNIPHLDLVATSRGIHRQFVFGRLPLLKAYDNCPDLFHTLRATDWDNLYHLNDLFVYCSQSSTENPNFPIRIVTSPRGGLHSRGKKKGLTDYNLLTTLHLLNQHEKTSVTTREICQFARYFKLHIYQSQSHPNIFFASKKPPSRLRPHLERHQLSPVVIR